MPNNKEKSDTTRGFVQSAENPHIVLTPHGVSPIGVAIEVGDGTTLTLWLGHDTETGKPRASLVHDGPGLWVNLWDEFIEEV